MRRNEKSENYLHIADKSERGSHALVVASQTVGVLAECRPPRRPFPFVSGQSFLFPMPVATIFFYFFSSFFLFFSFFGRMRLKKHSEKTEDARPKREQDQRHQIYQINFYNFYNISKGWPN